MKREEEIFERALALTLPEARSAYLLQACAGDADLRRHVDELLAAHQDAHALEFLKGGDRTRKIETLRAEEPLSEKPGDRIGRYKLLEQIGEGGCGVVYMAEQQEPVRRRVALKVIKLGMDTKTVIARFEAERQALALMDHPSIAQVFDAGATETGRPYFVMELVRGTKITDYCDQHNLSTRERMNLFIQVCHAIQHAHQKGIIHRDIKPSNILVMLADDKPVPKVIDFGIAKATAQQMLTDKTLFTAFEQFIGTPVYMSPEQAGMSGLDIDTRSDIYSLGVLLYELFTGRTPLETKTLAAAGVEEMLRIIREQEPVRPSTRLHSLSAEELTTTARQRHADPPRLIHQLRGDLDWIVMKCLEKDRTRRYETANSLAQDLDRHSAHEPVVARPPSRVYRVQKFVRRNQVMVTAASMVALALVLGIVASTWLAVRERHQRNRAEAGKLLAIAQAQLEDDPTAALAYTRASLELADTREARRFAVKVLWRGPMARVLPVERLAREQRLPEDSSPLGWVEMSPDGRWLAIPSRSNRRVLIFPWDGGPPRALPPQPDGDVPRPPDSKNTWASEFGPRSDLLITGGSGSTMRLWSFPELKKVRTIELGGFGSWGDVRGSKLLTCTAMDHEGTNLLLRAWPLPEGNPQVLGTLPSPKEGWEVDPSGTIVAYGREGTVCVRSLASSRPVVERVLGQSGDEVRNIIFDSRGDRLASLHGSGEIRIWSMAEAAADPLRVLRGPKYQAALLLFQPEGRLVAQAGPNNGFFLWDLDGSPDAEPVAVGRPGQGAAPLGTFDRDGEWLVTSWGVDTVEFWPVRTPKARVIRGITSTIWDMAFIRDSRWLATMAIFQPVRLWPLGSGDGAARDLLPEEPCVSLATHPQHSDVLVGTAKGEVFRCPTDGGSPRQLPGGWAEKAGRRAMAAPVAFDRTGRWALATPYSGQGFSDPKDRVVRMWDLELSQERIYSIAHLTDSNWTGAGFLGFDTDGRLYGSLGKAENIVRLTLPSEPDGEISGETLVSASSSRSLLSPDGRMLLVLASKTRLTHNMQYEQFLLLDLVKGTSRQITTHGDRLSSAAQFDPSGRVIVTGDVDGVVRVGPVSGEEPHLLVGHKGMITALAISPDGHWIASATEESIRLWPMPDLAKAPLHRLPHDKLLAKLDNFTNIRAVRDETSSTGWSLEVSRFPGWETEPEW